MPQTGHRGRFRQSHSQQVADHGENAGLQPSTANERRREVRVLVDRRQMVLADHARASAEPTLGVSSQ